MLTVTRLSQGPKVRVVKDQQPATRANIVKVVPLVDHRLKPAESLEIIQALLLVSFYLLPKGSSLNLLLDQCFEDRAFESISKDFRQLNHELETNGLLCRDRARHGPFTPPGPLKRQRLFKILDRKNCSVTEKLYCWLEGIFDALSKRYLQSAQISIILDKAQPNNVIESYSFKFNYNEDPEIFQAQTATGKVEASTKFSMTTGAAKEKFCTVVRQLVSLCQTLPNLPERRYLTTHLFYTQDCPVGYCPPAFQPNYDLDIRVAESKGWRMRKAGIGNLNLGFHDVHLGVNHLAFLQRGQSSAEELTIPTNLCYPRLLHRKEPGYLTKETAFDIQVVEDSVRTTSGLSSTHSLLISREEACAQNATPANAMVTAATDAELVKENKVVQRLRNMIRTPSIANDLTQTQPMVNDMNVQDDTDGWVLVPSKDHELWGKRDKHIKNASLPEELWRCRCECGYQQKEGDMVQCDCCDSWQHRHCYALEGTTLGTTHVCYTCLLEDEEMPLLQELRSISAMRRICWFIRNQTVPMTESILLKQLGYSTSELGPMLHNLKKEGLIVNAIQSDRKKQGLLVLNNQAALASCEGYGLLHPLAFLQHCYKRLSPSTPSTVERVESDSSVKKRRKADVSDVGNGTDELVAVSSDRYRSASLQENKETLPAQRRRSNRIAARYQDSTPFITPSIKRCDTESLRKRKRFCSSNAKSPVNVSEKL